MKLLTLLISVLLSIANGCGSSEQNLKDLTYNEFANFDSQRTDSILVHIQKKIDSEFTKSFVNRNTKSLDEILLRLGKIDNPISKYWQAYVKYNKSIYFISTNNAEKSESLVDEAIQLLENAPKSSESYALLGTLHNFSVQFKNPIAVGIVSKKATDNFKKAISLEPKNLRAYLGLGSLDYYTPEKYGGKKETVNYMTKALEQPDQPLKNPILPSWGRNTAYEILIKYYIEKDNKEKAKEYYKEAVEKFPNDYQITSLSKKLI